MKRVHITCSGLYILSSIPLSKEVAATVQAVLEEELAQLEDSFGCKKNLKGGEEDKCIELRPYLVLRRDQRAEP
jgi:hypothetical protein